MTLVQQLVTIAMVALGTVLTRFLPFWLFPAGKPTPPFIRYLGRVLPPAALGLLVIYCVKDVPFVAGRWHGLPELLSMSLVTALHLWRKNMFLSIAAGTACYMLLVQFVFV